jgi:hypothetical protein
VDLCCIAFGFNIFMFLPVLPVMKRTGYCLSGSQKISEQPSLQLRHVSRFRRLTLASSVRLKEDWDRHFADAVGFRKLRFQLACMLNFLAVSVLEPVNANKVYSLRNIFKGSYFTTPSIAMAT